MEVKKKGNVIPVTGVTYICETLLPSEPTYLLLKKWKEYYIYS